MKRILVVDDDPATCEIVARVLSQHYEVTTCHNGAEALTRLALGGFHLVVLDVVMPEMDGWAVLKQIREDPKLTMLPVVFLTGRSSEDDRLVGLRLGADDYLGKPFSREELSLRVDRLLLRAERHAHSLDESGMEGSLKDFGVAPLLSLLAMENKTGLLQLVHHNLQITLFLKGGQVLCARRQDGVNQDSYSLVFDALSWEEGSFSFGTVDVDVEDELKQTTSQLLLDVAREMDEQRYGNNWEDGFP